MAAELGEGTDKALEALETALEKQPEDANLRYDAARAFALASQAGRQDRTRRRAVSWRTEPFDCSRKRSRTAMPTSAEWTTTSPSTRSATTPHSPRS